MQGNGIAIWQLDKDLADPCDSALLPVAYSCTIALQELRSMSFDLLKVTVPSTTILHTSVPCELDQRLYRRGSNISTLFHKIQHSGKHDVFLIPHLDGIVGLDKDYDYVLSSFPEEHKRKWLFN